MKRGIGITWCPYCGEPHSLRETVCPTTARPLGRSIHNTVAPAGNPAVPAAAKLIAGRYELLRPIGKGGMGEVFEARDNSLQRVVAIKLVFRASENARARLQHEGRVIAALQHPSICEVFDVGVLLDGVPYLVLERLQGETLSKRMRRGKRLALAPFAQIFSQVLAGLQCAHTRGVIHRDMKPANIFLTSPSVDGRPRVKLLDFGLAKDIFDTASSGMTRPGRAVGTPGYMSPDQLTGRVLDGRSDIFSVGVMMFEALTGTHPFAGPNAHMTEIAANIVGGAHAELKSLRDLPPGLVTLVESALSKDAAQRPPSAEVFAAEIHALDLEAYGSGDEGLSFRFDIPRLGRGSSDSVSSVISAVSSSTSVRPPRSH